MRAARHPAPARPIGFAHRGARAECRDNTIASFRRALELGARALESDVWVTADGVAVLDHDGQARRGLRRVPIRSVRREELAAHIPTLRELYERCGTDFELSLDVKDPGAAAPAMAVAADAGVLARTWLCGRPPQLAAWRAASADVRLVDSTRLSRIGDDLAGHAGSLAAAGVDAVNLRWPEWDATRVAAVHRAGLLAFAWDTQRIPVIAAMVGLGVDGVYSDHVARMVSVLRPGADDVPPG